MHILLDDGVKPNFRQLPAKVTRHKSGRADTGQDDSPRAAQHRHALQQLLFGVHIERRVHGRHVLFDQLFANQPHRVIAADLIMHRHGLRVGVAHQRFADRQLEGGEPLKANLLGKLHHAGLAHAGFTRQLLRAEMARAIGLRKQKIRQLLVALGKACIALANAN